MFFRIDGKRVGFERTVREEYLKLKSSLLHWIVTYRPQNRLTGPIIYGMAIPLSLVDLCTGFYPACCAPIYGIVNVRRANNIIFETRNRAYLNVIKKFHCTYCAYGGGLIASCTEIISRTEQYFAQSGIHARSSETISAMQESSSSATSRITTKREDYRIALGKSD